MSYRFFLYSEKQIDDYRMDYRDDRMDGGQQNYGSIYTVKWTPATLLPRKWNITQI